MDLENKKYDLEKAKEDCRRHEDALEEAQSCMCGHCHECGFDPSEMKAALDEIERLRSENERLAKMFAENTYIESAHMEPGFYDINLRGQGAMLLIGHLIQMFRDTGGENFITNTLQMTLPDGKTNELFELTIQKVNGEDSPAMKITRLTSEIAAKDVRIEELEQQIELFRAGHNDLVDRCQKAEARIKELEEANRNIDKRRDEMAAFIERLEAAFLKSETERKFYTTINGMNSEFDWNGYPECPQNGIHKEWFRQQAREALERIKAGGKDEA